TCVHQTLVFFFQAEDGIRDFHVTGVQTCALPISCSHHGRTPPCAEGLINAGVARVVGACSDPNPLVAGLGYQLLRDAGIDVITPCLEAQAQELNRGFMQRMRTGMPWVRLKLAHSLDGRSAMASGESQWITGP